MGAKEPRATCEKYVTQLSGFDVVDERGDVVLERLLNGVLGLIFLGRFSWLVGAPSSVRSCALAQNDLFEAFDGGCVEDVLVGEWQVVHHGGHHDLGRCQRRSTNLKEVIVHADVLVVQGLMEDTQQLGLELRGGLLCLLLGEGGFDGGKRLLVYLAVGGERNLVKLHERLRDHVGSEIGPKMCLKGLDVYLILCGKVGRQVVRLAMYDDDRAHAHARIGVEHALDLAQLHGQAAQLDLVVHPAAILDLAVLAQAREVSGSIRRHAQQPHEAARVEIFAPHVAAAHAGAQNRQLTCGAQRLQAAGTVDGGHVHVYVGDTDGDVAGTVHHLHGAADGCLGGTVAVHNVEVGVDLAQSVEQCGRERLGAKVHGGEAGHGAREVGSVQHVGHVAGGAAHHVHVVVHHELCDAHGVKDLLAGGQHHGEAVGQGHELLHDGEVEGERGDGQARVPAAGVAQNLVVLVVVVHEVHQVAVGEHHALGTSRGTRGVDDVGQVVRRDVDVEVVRVALRSGLLCLHDGEIQVGHLLEQLCALLQHLGGGKHEPAA